MTGHLYIVAAPSGAGKTTLVRMLLENDPLIRLSISTTTRNPRPGEVDGEHYYFVDDAAFDALVADGALLEHATVHNKYRYGTPREPIERALADAAVDSRGVALRVQDGDPLVTDEGHWSGFRPDKIDELAARLA